MSIITNSQLQIQTRLTMLYLQEKQINGQVKKSKIEIAKDLGITRQTVLRSIKELKQCGYVEELRDSINKASIIIILII